MLRILDIIGSIHFVIKMFLFKMLCGIHSVRFPYGLLLDTSVCIMALHVDWRLGEKMISNKTSSACNYLLGLFSRC